MTYRADPPLSPYRPPDTYDVFDEDMCDWIINNLTYDRASFVADVLNGLTREEIEEGARRDEYHTMDELYEYHMLYNAMAANAMPDISTKSWRHSDGEPCFGGGWFVVYMELPTGQISNHYRAENWDLFKVPAVETAPEYDGHTPQDAARRMAEFLSEKGTTE